MAETAAGLRRELAAATRRADEASARLKAPSAATAAGAPGGAKDEVATLRTRVEDLQRQLKLAEAEIEDADGEADVRPGTESTGDCGHELIGNGIWLCPRDRTFKSG